MPRINDPSVYSVSFGQVSRELILIVWLFHRFWRNRAFPEGGNSAIINSAEEGSKRPSYAINSVAVI